MQQLAAVVLVLAVAWAAAWFLRSSRKTDRDPEGRAKPLCLIASSCSVWRRGIAAFALLRKKASTPGMWMARGKSRQIEILDRARLTPQHSIHLLSIGGETILVGVHPRGFMVLRGGSGNGERE